MKLFVDTEITFKGTNLKIPRICQLAMIFTNDILETVSVVSSFIKPEGWEVTKSAQQYHGISTADCEKYGLPIKNLMNVFNFYAEHSDIIIAHNSDHDKKLITNEMLLAGMMPSFTPWYCTMKSSTDIVAIPNQNGFSNFKWPSLAEAFKFFTGKPIEHAHDALYDAKACREVYRGILGHNQKNEFKLRLI